MCDVIVVVKYNTSSAIYLQWDYQQCNIFIVRKWNEIMWGRHWRTERSLEKGRAQTVF